MASSLPDKHSNSKRHAEQLEPSMSFGAGAFIHGPRAVVRNNTIQYPWCSALFSTLLRNAFPDAPFSSCVLQMNKATRVHRDAHNDEDFDNIVLACSEWQGGKLWLEDSEGDTMLEDGSKGRLLSVQPKAQFSAHIPHKAMPVRCRVILVGFHIRDAWRLKKQDCQWLRRLGFPVRCAMD